MPDRELTSPAWLTEAGYLPYAVTCLVQAPVTAPLDARRYKAARHRWRMASAELAGFGRLSAALRNAGHLSPAVLALVEAERALLVSTRDEAYAAMTALLPAVDEAAFARL